MLVKTRVFLRLQDVMVHLMEFTFLFQIWTGTILPVFLATSQRCLVSFENMPWMPTGPWEGILQANRAKNFTSLQFWVGKLLWILGSFQKNKTFQLLSTIHIPGTCLSSFLGLQPSKTMPFPIKTKVIWGPGIYIYIVPWDVKTCMFHKKSKKAVRCWTRCSNRRWIHESLFWGTWWTWILFRAWHH